VFSGLKWSRSISAYVPINVSRRFVMIDVPAKSVVRTLTRRNQAAGL